MARMSIDDRLARDTRVDKLARLCGWSRRETRACLEDIWTLCYDRIVPYLTHDDIELAALRDAIAPPTHAAGFVAALIESGLARRAVAQDRNFTAKNGEQHAWKDQQWRDRIYLCGASDNIGYLLMQSVLGKRGGDKSACARANQTKRRLSDPTSVAQATLVASSEIRFKPPIATAPDSASASALPPDLQKEDSETLRASAERPIDQLKRKADKLKNGRPTESELQSVRVVLAKLGEWNGVTYSITDAHAQLIVRQLRKGVTEEDLRRVVWFCGRKWEEDEKMQDFLRPETLFGPQNISKYLDPSKAAYAKWRAERSPASPDQPSDLVRNLVARGTEGGDE
jgi:uncharacterized phage protein (TIGR02220 family)